MPYEQSIDASAAARLDELATLLELARTTFHDQGDQFHWSAQPGSVGADEASAADAGVAMAQLARHAPTVASIYLRTASELLGGLAAAYRAAEVFAAPEPLVRGVLENAVYANWVLDPRVTGPVRAARACVAELATVAHARRAVAELAGEDNDEHRILQDRFDQLKAMALTHFDLTMANGGRPKYVVDGEQYPDFKRAVQLHTEAHGNHVPGRGLYASLCSSTHPRGWLARLDVVQGQPGEAEQQIDLNYLGRLTTAALSPYYSGLVLLARYHGWNGTAVLVPLENVYSALFPGVFR